MKIPPDKDSLPCLLKALKQPNAAMRVFAATAIRELGRLGEEAVPSLTELLHDANEEVRIAAVKSLGQMGPAAVPALLTALTSSSKHLRREAVWALGKMEMGPISRTAVPGLAASLKDKDIKVRKGAATALAALGPSAEAAIPNLLESLRDSNLVFCRLVALTLVKIGSAAVPALTQTLAHPDGFIRREANWALGKIEQEGAPPPMGEAGEKQGATIPIPVGKSSKRKHRIKAADRTPDQEVEDPPMTNSNRAHHHLLGTLKPSAVITNPLKL